MRRAAAGWPWGLAVTVSPDYGHTLQVVGEDPQPDPGPGTGQSAQPRTAQPEAALEVADPGLDPDPPVAQPPERPGPFMLSPGLAWGAGALQPHPPDPQFAQGTAVAGGAE